MSVKSKSRTLGRMIRRVTGVPLPICMGIGKMVVQCKYEGDIVEKFPEVVKREHFTCGDRCCSYEKYQIVGPKGILHADYRLSVENITKEYKLSQVTF